MNYTLTTVLHVQTETERGKRTNVSTIEHLNCQLMTFCWKRHFCYKHNKTNWAKEAETLHTDITFSSQGQRSKVKDNVTKNVSTFGGYHSTITHLHTVLHAFPIGSFSVFARTHTHTHIRTRTHTCHQSQHLLYEHS